MSNYTSSIVFCSYSLKEFGGFSLRKRHSFIFKRPELIPVLPQTPAPENLTTSDASQETEVAEKKGPGVRGKAQKDQDEGPTENMEVKCGEQ